MFIENYYLYAFCAVVVDTESEGERDVNSMVGLWHEKLGRS